MGCIVLIGANCRVRTGARRRVVDVWKRCAGAPGNHGDRLFTTSPDNGPLPAATADCYCRLPRQGCRTPSVALRWFP